MSCEGAFIVRSWLWLGGSWRRLLQREKM